MNKWQIILLLILFVSSCIKGGNSKKVLTSSKEVEVDVKKLDNTDVPQDILTLNTELNNKSDEDDLEQNLFGEFYCDRVSFYVIDSPQNTMYSSGTKSIILYYLDGKLRKTSYHLQQDIESNLIRQFGNFKITGLDFKNRKVIISEPVVSKTSHGVSLNQKLDNYRMKWTFGDVQVVYNVDKSKGEYIYVERVKSYDKEFREIERACI